MTEHEIKYIHRLPPCPAYDIAGTELWLEEMAGKGYHLSPHDGFTFGVATFEVDSPRRVKYRLEPIPKGGSSVNGDEFPSEEEQELYREYGWEFVAQWKHFFVYRSVKPDVRELHTDPEVQALALKHVEKDLRGSIISAFIILLLNMVNIMISNMELALFVSMVNLGTLLVLGFILWYIWLISDAVRNVLRIHRLRKRLKEGGSVREESYKRERFYIHKRILRWLLTAVLFVALLTKVVNSDQSDIPLSDYTKEVPFATMADLIPDGRYESFGMRYSNTVNEWSDLLAPENYRWDEVADIKLPDGSALSGSYDVYYHRTVSPVIARIVAEEYYLLDRFNEDFELLDCPALDVDFAALYIGKYHYPTLIVQEGCQMIRAEFWITATPTDGYIVSEWAKTMAESLIK